MKLSRFSSFLKYNKCSTIIGKEIVVKNIGKWFPFKCQIIDIKFNGILSTLELSIIPDFMNNIMITLCFEGVRDISIPKITSHGVKCLSLEIIDYENNQLEDINWWVGDFKTDAVSFFAKAIIISSVNEIKA